MGIVPLVDIDECEEDISGCNQVCNNQNGSYNCSCLSDGFRLEQDQHTCVGKNKTVFLTLSEIVIEVIPTKSDRNSLYILHSFYV